jgi:hypothetical protein
VHAERVVDDAGRALSGDLNAFPAGGVGPQCLPARSRIGPFTANQVGRLLVEPALGVLLKREQLGVFLAVLPDVPRLPPLAGPLVAVLGGPPTVRLWMLAIGHPHHPL